jgi:hypothetical protein
VNDVAFYKLWKIILKHTAYEYYMKNFSDIMFPERTVARRKAVTQKWATMQKPIYYLDSLV